jgi:L-alanine-DL-glutamate epimerase-like enolase superfamily enzyme
MECGGVSVIHPDMLTVGGALEMKKLGDMCEKYGVAMAIHMAESPIACMAAIHAAAAVQNCLAVEFHSVDIPWWNDLAIGIENPLFKDRLFRIPITENEVKREMILEELEKYGYTHDRLIPDSIWSVVKECCDNLIKDYVSE